MNKFSILIIVTKRAFSIFLILAIITVFGIAFICNFMANNSRKQELSRSVNSIGHGNSNSLIQKAKLAIIIDDFGQNRKGVDEMMSINKHLTFAVMPFLTYTKTDALNAHTKGYEVIVHLPLEANSAPLKWVGPKPILANMQVNEIKQVTLDALEDVPYAVGANIHMGSKAGNEKHVVSSILDIIKEKNMFFVDSRSEDHPIAKKLADKIGIICHDRDVFLDGKKPKSYIIEQLRKAGDIALKNGKAIAIGHVGTEGGQITAEAISEIIPVLESNNIQLVFVSEL
ncbi:MAG TPA: divergent polysaccharide deacetylase family protein [Pseudobacteroides sp.]|uniref:divergent polysaccharide deacetylase family protein n=1 Tax=Pseudobacteroides sp. TaxID=1968840 RepID=UPI002F93BF0F